MSFYLIVANNQGDIADLEKVIKKEAQFPAWWHWLPSAYVVKTDLALPAVQKVLMENWREGGWLVSPLRTNEMNGWLPEDAWKWFKKHTNQRKTIRVVRKKEKP